MTFDEFKEKYELNLNEQQTNAVKEIDGPTLLLAVPGSGKTSVLISRLGYMIECLGIDPGNILTVTYTVSATKDMKNRFEKLFGNEVGSNLEFRTINSLSYQIIKYYANIRQKTIPALEPNDRNILKIISDIYQTLLDEYPTESDLKSVRAYITYIKNMMFDDDAIADFDNSVNYPVKAIYDGYCEYMRTNNMMDYDDQMVYAYNILCHDSDILEYFQNKFKYICVDEAQDTSKIQHAIIEILAKKDKNIFMVGDEDQSIYGFRAAYPEALLNFDKTYENAKVLLMEENFRSTGSIVDSANQFIKKNTFRKDKNMITNNAKGDEIHEIKLKTVRSQYSYLVKVAENCRMETAILYRDNESIIPLVDLLERKGIDYQIKNSDLNFFTNKVIMDIRNIIEFAMNPKDASLFMRIYYKLGTYLKKEHALKICDIAVDRDMNILDIASGLSSIPDNTRKKCKQVQANLTKLLTERADKALTRILVNLEYNSYIERNQIKANSINTLKFLAINEKSAESLIARLDELNEIIRTKENTDSKLILSTIHSSKGLEYEIVFLLDIRDGIFPEKPFKDIKNPTEEDIKKYEEERRLFYVAVTRAKRRVHIFQTDQNSTFINELFDRKEIDPEEAKALEEKFKAEANRKRPPRDLLRKSSYVENASAKKDISLNSYEDYCQKIKDTMTINHKSFGVGKVISIDGDKIEVEFADKTSKCSIKFLVEHGLLID